MLLGDEGKLAVPGLFPYVEGMPVIVNKNEYQRLKISNGSEFTAVGIVHGPGLEEHVVNERLSVFLGPPSGILLQSEDTAGLQFPNLPEGTIMLGATSTPVPEKHTDTLCPEMQGKPGFKLGVTRYGLPCTPGFAMTDFKAQGRSMGKVNAGLYGRRRKRDGSGLERCEAISTYVQLSRARRLEDMALMQPLNADHFKQARMPKYLVAGIERLQRQGEKTLEGRNKGGAEE